MRKIEPSPLFPLFKADSLKVGLLNLVNKIYSNKKYPCERDMVVGKKDVGLLIKNITQYIEANVELTDCPDCDYSYSIGISESKDVPIIPDYAKDRKERIAWIKKYGKYHYQMYVSISRLGKFAIFYWTKYGYFLFERYERRYQSPHDTWQHITASLGEVLSKMDIILVPPSTFVETVDVDYEGKMEGNDRHPSILKLLFGEELH